MSAYLEYFKRASQSPTGSVIVRIDDPDIDPKGLQAKGKLTRRAQLINTARSNQRRQNAKLLPPGSPLHAKSPWDDYVVQLVCDEKGWGVRVSQSLELSGDGFKIETGEELL